MLHILIVGSSSEQTETSLRQLSGDRPTFVSETLPTAGLRQFKAEVPDVVIICDDDRDRADELARAMRGQTGGQFVHFIVQAPPFGDANEGQNFFYNWMSPHLEPQDLWDEIRNRFEIPDPDSESSPSRPEGSSEPSSGSTDNVPATRQQSDEAAVQSTSEAGVEKAGQRSASAIDPAVDLEIERLNRDVSTSEIENKIEAIRHADYFEILELPRDAGDTDVRQMYEILSGRYSEEAIPAHLEKQYEDELREIRNTLDDAWAVLGDTELRKTYRDQL